MTSGTTSPSNVFLHNQASQSTTLISQTSGSIEANGDDIHPSISGDGRFVAYFSTSTNMAPGVLDLMGYIYLHDRASGLTTLVNVEPATAAGGFPGGEFFLPSGGIRLNSDGQFVLLESLSNNLMPSLTWEGFDVFLHEHPNEVNPPQSLDVSVSGPGQGTITSSIPGIDCGLDCSESYQSGTAVVLTATPEEGFVFSGWSGLCTGTSSCTVVMSHAHLVNATFDPLPQPTFSLTVTFDPLGSGSGSITGDIGTINCPGVCSNEYPQGTSLLLTASANPGSAFAGWSDDGFCHGTAPCAVTMDQDHTVSAVFLPLHTLTVELAGSGQGAITSDIGSINCPGVCQDQYIQHSFVRLFAQPEPGSHLAGWIGTGECFSDVCDVLMENSSTVTAVFEPVSTLTVTVAGDGTVLSNIGFINCPGTCSSDYAPGTTVTLFTQSSPGSVFTGWTGAGCSGTGTCTITLTQHETVAATFTPLFALTIINQGAGTGTVSSAPSGIVCPTDCSEHFINGTTVTLSATPNAGSAFTGWNGAGCTGTSTCAVTMSQAETVTATFVPLFLLTVSADGSGTGTITSSPSGISCPGDCTEPYVSGTVVTLTATPALGSNFDGWSGSCSGQGDCMVSMSLAHAVTATFSAGPDFYTQIVKITIPPNSDSVRVSAPASFTPVDPSHTVALISGITQHAMGWTGQTTQDPQEISARVELIDGSTITATRSTSFNQSDTVWVLLVEYVGQPGGGNEFIVRDRRTHSWNSGQASISYGPITSVADFSKIVVFASGVENPNSNSNQFDRGDVRGWVDGTKNVQLLRGDGNGAIASVHQVVEFVGANWSIQTGDTIPDRDPGGANVNIASVNDMSTAWVYFTWSTNSANLDERGHRVWLTSPTNLRVQEDAKAGGNKTIRWFIIQNPQLVVQAGAADNQFSSSLSATIGGLTAVSDVTKAFAWVTGLTDGGVKCPSARHVAI